MLIPEEEQEFKGLPGSMIDKTRLKQYLTAVLVTCETPREVFDWSDFIKAVKTFRGKIFFRIYHASFWRTVRFTLSKSSLCGW